MHCTRLLAFFGAADSPDSVFALYLCGLEPAGFSSESDGASSLLNLLWPIVERLSLHGSPPLAHGERGFAPLSQRP